MSTPDSHQHHAFTKIITKVHDYTRIITNNHVTPYHASIYLSSSVNPNLFYPINCLDFTPTQQTVIKKGYIFFFISAMCYPTTWSLALRYGTTPMGYLNLKGIEVETILSKIHFIAALLQKDDTQYKLI